MGEFSGMRSVEERLRLIEDKLSVGSWSWDRVSDVVVWSPGLYRLLGVDASAVSPSLTFFESLAHPLDRLPFHESEPIATDARQKNRRFRLIRPDGGLRWIWSLAQTIFDRSGEVSRVVGVAADVTEVEDLRRADAAAKAFQEAMAKVLGAEFWWADDEGRMVEGSTWLERSQYAPHGSKGWHALVSPLERERIAAAWSKATTARAVYAETLALALSDGTHESVFVRGVPLREPAPNKATYVGIAVYPGGPIDIANARPAGKRAEVGPAHIRAARAYLGWSAEELAERSGVSLSTVRRCENDTGPSPRQASLDAMVLAFEAAGLSFWSDERGRPYFVAD